MTYSVVQTPKNILGSGGVTSVAATGSAIGSGSLVVGIVSWGPGGGITLGTISDDKGNTYTVSDSVNDTANVQDFSTFYLSNITNGPVTITANFVGGTGTFAAIMWSEVTGISTMVDPRDGHTGQVTTTNTTDGATSGSITTTVNGDFIWSVSGRDSGILPTAGTGFTLLVKDNGSGAGVSLATEWLAQSTAGSIAGTWTPGGSDNAVNIVIAFKGSATAQATSLMGQIWVQ